MPTINKIQDPKTGNDVELDENGVFPLSEGAIGPKKAEELFEKGEIVAYLDASNASVNEDKNEDDSGDYQTYQVDLDESVKNLLEKEGEFSEQFQNKVSDLFEASVNNKVNEKTEEIKEEFAGKLEEATEDLLESADSFLNYAVEEWMKENQVALETGARNHVMENLVSDLRKVFETHNINLPEEDVDQVNELEKKVEELENRINEKHQEVRELRTQIKEDTKYDIISEIGQGLAETSFERFKALAEEFDFDSEERFREKLNNIKESYFTGGTPSEDDKPSSTIEESANEEIPSYIKDATRFLKK